MTSRVTYLGNLRTESVHINSTSAFITDAPVDNNGKGEAFSPTDTVATGLASCMLTVMGIKAARSGLRSQWCDCRSHQDNGQ
jgi:putative redox protein